MKLTSVDWIHFELYKYMTGNSSFKSAEDVLSYANEMHKQESLDTYNAGYRDGESNQCFSNPTQFEDVSKFSNAENYYNTTFKK